MSVAFFPLFLLATAQAGTSTTPPPLKPPGKAMNGDAPIETVTLSPPFGQPFTCIEHPAGQLAYLGDALGTDCTVVGGIEGGTGFARPYRTDGRTNEDWYGWNAPVLAPFDGVVLGFVRNPVVNTPGTTGKPPAQMLLFRRADGMTVVYAHVQDIGVKAGDAVKAGQPIARDGNNGFARAPHVHIGAYKGDIAYQIRFDQRAEQRLFPADQ